MHTDWKHFLLLTAFLNGKLIRRQPIMTTFSYSLGMGKTGAEERCDHVVLLIVLLLVCSVDTNLAVRNHKKFPRIKLTVGMRQIWGGLNKILNLTLHAIKAQKKPSAENSQYWSISSRGEPKADCTTLNSIAWVCIEMYNVVRFSFPLSNATTSSRKFSPSVYISWLGKNYSLPWMLLL